MTALSLSPPCADQRAARAPLLSVIVPALLCDLELQRCVDSVRLAMPDAAQREIVLVLPARHVDEARQRFPDAKVLAESRPSVYAAMNDGVSFSTGRYLYFLGKDDILLPAVRELLRVLADEAPAALFASVYWGTAGLHSTRSSRAAILFRNVCHQGVIYARDVLERHGPFVRRFRVRADQLLNIRVLWDESLRGCILHSTLPIAWYAATGLSFSVPDRAFYRVQPAIIRRHLGPLVAWAWWAYKKLRPEKGM